MKLHLLLLLICTNLALPSCTNSSLSDFLTVDRLSEKMMKNLKELKYLVATLDGSRVMIPIDATTNVIIDDSFSEEGKLFSEMGYIERKAVFFDVPPNIIKYELVDSHKSLSEQYCSVEDISKKYYDENTYLHGPYKTYQAFKDSTLKFSQVGEGFQLLDNGNKIKTCAKYTQKTFTYKVETSDGVVQMRLLFLRLDGEWKLGAVISIKQ